MEVTTKELREKPGKIIAEVNRGLEIVVTYRGKALAKIVPYQTKRKDDTEKIEENLFGIWKDRKDIGNPQDYVESLRKERRF